MSRKQLKNFRTLEQHLLGESNLFKLNDINVTKNLKLECIQNMKTLCISDILIQMPKVHRKFAKCQKLEQILKDFDVHL